MEKVSDYKAAAAEQTKEDDGETRCDGKKQASGKQLAAFVFILALAAKMFLLPMFLIRTAGRDAYIIIAINCGVDLIALTLMIIAVRISQSSDFFTLLTDIFGKVIAKIIVALVGLFLFLKLNVATAEILTFFGDNVFAEFDKSLMIIVLLVFLSATACHTLRALCRLNELLVPIIVISLAMLIVIVIMTGFDFANILPAMQNGKAFTDGLTRHAAWIGDFTPLVFFVGRTKLKKHTHWFAAGAGVLGSSVAVFFALVLSAAFGNVPMLVDSTTNLSSMLQYTVGNVYGRIDMLSSVLWSISVFVEAALLFYSLCRCAGFVLGTKKNMAVAIGASVALYVVQVFALIDITVFAAVITTPACSAVTVGFSVAVPVLAVVCAAVGKKREKREEEKANDSPQKTSDI